MELTNTDVPQLNKIPIGSAISLITSVQYRYEGKVAAINSIENTITLQHVRFWGAENRGTDNTTTKTGDSKSPAIGSLFDSVTFWMSNVLKLIITDELDAKKELSDNAVKAASTIEANQQLEKAIPKAMVPSSDSAASPQMSQKINLNDRAPKPTRPLQNQRQQIYNPRRGRNLGPPRQNYMPYNGNYNQPLNQSRGRNMAQMVEIPYNMGNGRSNGRRSGPQNGNGRRSYPQQDRNGGMFVYLPPDMTAVYRPQGMQMMQQSPYNGPVGNGRRRINERRNGPPRIAPTQTSSVVDCNTPYDFETANAELEAELAKISLNSEGHEDQDSPSSGDRQIAPLNTDTTIPAGTATGSGASGDSSMGAVTTDIVSANAADNNQTLSKGEFYVKEKCFFDQISRSEGGPRGPIGGNKGNFHNERGRFNNYNHNRMEHAPNHNRSTYGPSTARRERQLNIETFGPIAARSIYNQRRRPTGSVPRDLLVSATA